LPESQLDRFLLRIHLGYPDREAERALLLGEDRRTLLARAEPLLDAVELARLQAMVGEIHVAPALVSYLLALLEATRNGHFITGLSPRAGLALLAAARGWAFLEGHEMVLPEDVQAVFAPVTGHRLRHAGDGHPVTSMALSALLESVPLP